MPTYRFFILDRTARFIVMVEETEAADDGAALSAAQAKLSHGPVEIWQGIRRVALLRPPSEEGAPCISAGDRAKKARDIVA